MLALGLMSGTSLDGIDAALLETNGHTVQRTGAWLTEPYDDAFRARLRALLASENADEAKSVERELTLRHAAAVRRLLREAAVDARDVAVIGFHGQTIAHRPEARFTWQIGDGALLAAETGINVVNDFRSNDVKAGGQGAPLVPLFHAALAEALPKPLCIVNLGGVGNLTYLGKNGEVIACDTGPGNALINDAAFALTGKDCDLGGALAAQGTAHTAALAALLADPFFALPPPKSLDRNHFSALASKHIATLEGRDQLATLTAFTAAAVAAAAPHFPLPPRAWYVCGGGQHNLTLMAELQSRLPAEVHSVNTLGWQGDALEAQAFAFLAVRALHGLPLSLPSTTGVPAPMPGGKLHASRV